MLEFNKNKNMEVQVMMKGKFVKTIALSMFCIGVLNISNIYAENNFEDQIEPRVTTSYNWSIDENKTKSTSFVNKGADNTATNEVLSLKVLKSNGESSDASDNTKMTFNLLSWVVDSKENIVTRSVGYTKPGQYHMKYTKTPSGNVKMRIKNPIGSMNDGVVSTKGKFHS